MTSLLDARAVSVGGRLQHTGLTIEAGSMVAVIGPNGGGKTSLLRSLARTEDSAGAVTIEGYDVDQAGEAQRRRLLAFLPASREAPWPVAVADLLAFGLGARDPGRIDWLVDQLELGPLRDRPIDRLSTGERARAMFGRAIAGRARLLLLDEPLSNLDPYWVLRTLAIIRAEVEANQSAALVSVHDLAMAGRFDRVLLLNDGAIIADGAPEAVLQSTSFADAFRINRNNGGWAISWPEDRRSSP